jgi:hypothetical protein
MKRKMDARLQFLERAPRPSVNMRVEAVISRGPLRRNQPMKVLLSLVAVLGALAATKASAQGVDLSGPYRCVQMCQEGFAGPALVTQRGWDMNMVNEAGVPSRAWIDRPGHIWAPGWNQGAIYSPDGMVIQFDRGTVWQRDLGEPEVVLVPRGQASRRVAVAPPVESAPPRVAPRAAAPVERAAPRAAAPVERAAVARNAFDGPWSVVISTQSGPCDPQYRFGVQIINGNIVYEGGGAVNAQGSVGPNGGVAVSVSSAGQSANGQGRLSRDSGGGNWRGQGPGGACAGTWQAARRG